MALWKKEKPDRRLRSSLRLALWQVGFASAAVSLTGGPFIAGFVAAVEGDPILFGIITGLVPLGVLAQIPAAKVVHLMRSRRKFFVITRYFVAAIWLTIAAIVLLHPSHGAIIAMFVLLYGCSCLLLSAGELARFTWVRDLVPASLRGRFLGALNQWMFFAALPLALVFGKLIDLIKEGYADYIVPAHGVVFAGGGLLYFLSAVAARRAHEPVLTDPAEGQLLWSSVKSMVHNRPFGKYVWFYMYAAFTQSIENMAEFYLLSEMGYSYTFIIIFSILSRAIGALLLGRCGRLIDQVGNRPVMLITFGIKVLWCSTFVFMTPDRSGLVVLGYVLASVRPANLLVHQSMLMKVLPTSTLMGATSLFNTLTAVPMIVGPILAGYLIESGLPRQADLVGATFSNWQLLFLISVLMRAVLVMAVNWLEEPDPRKGNSARTPAPIGRPAD